MDKYLCELVGTFFLVLLGDGVCMSGCLKKSGFAGANQVYITIGWGIAVMVPAFCFGYSGASFNPALTIALAAVGRFPWAEVPGYVVAQMIGGFLGAAWLSIIYKDHLDATEAAGETTLGVYATGPSIPNKGLNIVQEIAATGVLVFTICSIPGTPALGTFPVLAIIMACGMSFGGLTGYAMNPARDLSPRVAHAVFRKNDKGGNNWGYAMVPVIGPILGGLAGAFLWKLLPFLANH